MIGSRLLRVCLAIGPALLVVCALAQTKSKIPACTMKECKCMNRVDKIQAAAMAPCFDGGWKDHYKSQADCYQKNYVDRCSIAESWTDYDTDSGKMQLSEDGNNYTLSSMGPMCAKACMKHDCKCGADSTPTPTCHFGHQPSDHAKDDK